MKKKITSLFVIAVVAALMTGYSLFAVKASEITTLLGQVTSVSGSTVTLALASENTPGNNGAQPSGSPPSGAQPSGSPPSVSPTDTTAGGDSGKTPPSAPPSGGGTPGGLTLTGETKTVTITDSTVITIDQMGKSTAGKLSDISVGSIVTVTLSGDAVTKIAVRTAAGRAQGTQATASQSAVTVNGSAVSVRAYLIGENNYFKLRDIAQLLNGTDKQFDVGYDSSTKSISLTSGKAYTSVGGELDTSDAAQQASASVSSSTLSLDGTALNLTAYTINGNNYYKLRDIAAAIDFSVTYDSAAATIVIDTSSGYTGQ